MSIDLAPALAGLLRQLAAPYDDTRRVLVEAHPSREQEVRAALGDLPRMVAELVDVRFDPKHPLDTVDARPVYESPFPVTPRTIRFPEAPEPVAVPESPERALLRRIVDAEMVWLDEAANGATYLRDTDYQTSLRLTAAEVALIRELQPEDEP